MSETPINAIEATRKRGALRIGWRIARVLAAVYLGAILLMLYMESRLLYPIPPQTRGDWKAPGLLHEDVSFQSADGTKLHGWFLPHATSKRAILYFHGNGVHVADCGRLGAQLRDELHANVFIFDYRGYGRSEGSPNEAGCIADGKAARDWLANRMGIKPHDIILLGHSLGGGMAVALAADGGAKALVIENTFSSVADVAADTFWWLPVRLVLQNRYDSVSRIRQYAGPVFQCHGSNDTLVPCRFGRRLFEAAPTKNKHFLEGAGLGHDDGPPDDYYLELARFLDEVDRANTREAG